MSKSLVKFLNGLLKMGIPVVAWLMLLGIFNLVLPIYFWPATEAQLTISAFIIGFLLMILITHYAGFTKILGAGHVLWLPLVIYLLSSLDFSQLQDPFRLWIAGTVFLNSISLIIDVTDVIRYIQGDTTDLVQGL